MTSKGKVHQKHPPVARPQMGNYGRNEISIVGAPCKTIERVVHILSELLIEQFKSIYVDANHRSFDFPTENKLSVFADHQSHHRLAFSHHLNEYDRKIALRNFDMVWVNGNHFTAKDQIIIINEGKKESLRKRTEQLTQVKAVILDDGMDAPFDFLINTLDNNVPIFSIGDLPQVADLICREYPVPPLYGLVLAGGKSSRMGYDKSKINYHGKEQQEHLADVMSTYCDRVFISKKEKTTDLSHDVIADSFEKLGPYGAIMSAFKKYPDAAWLVAACDIPLLQGNHLKRLVDERKASKVATCYYNPDTHFPEPLITLWEPKAYPILLQYLALGYSCPRKVLINSDVQILRVDDHSFMANVNSPKDREGLKM